MIVKRENFGTHCHLYHTKGDINYLSNLATKVDLKNYEMECYSCKAVISRKDMESHLKSSCTKEKVRLLMAHYVEANKQETQ